MKYIDLAPTIKQDRTRGPITGLDGESYALKWLDEHPERVPGWTITESESKGLFDTARRGINHWPAALEFTGITVVPDPEPTNAELLVEILERENEKWLDLEGSRQSTAEELADILDRAGVTAPKDDA